MSVGAPAPPRPSARPVQTGTLWAVLLLTGFGGIGWSWFVAQHSLVGARWRFVVLIGLWVPLWVAGAWAATRLPTRAALIAVVLLAALLRLAAATGTTPSISSDLYRYAWDAHVQLRGIDPYRYPPDAAALRSIREGFWPSPATCHHIRERTGCTLLNRPKDRTIYPAAAEAWFVVVHLFNPGDAGSRPWQLAGGLVDDGAVIAIAVALRDRRKDPRAVAWYALSPLPVIEFAGNGHVDGVALLLMVGSLLALHRSRRTWAGVLIGLAIMVKLYPGLALAAGWRRGRGRMVLAAAAVCVAAEAPHVVAVGTRVVGYIPGYLKEEKYSNGGRFVLLSLLHLPGRLTAGLAVACIAGAAAWVWRSRLDPATGLTIGLAVLMFVTTPAQPWYAVAVAGVAVAAGRPWLLIVPLAAEPYYAANLLGYPHQVAVGRLCYGAALLVVAVPLAHRLSTRWRPRTLPPADERAT